MTEEPLPVDSWGDALAKADNLPPEGGRFRLPDGTIIEIVPDEDEPPNGVTE